MSQSSVSTRIRGLEEDLGILLFDRNTRGFHGLFPGSVLDDLLVRYRQKHPAITVEIIEGSAREADMHLRPTALTLHFWSARSICRITNPSRFGLNRWS